VRRAVVALTPCKQGWRPRRRGVGLTLARAIP
jgi:hypothetical protein